MVVLVKAEARLVIQVLNNLANFLGYDPRRTELASHVDTLKSLFRRMRSDFRSPTGLGEFMLSPSETQAVIAATQEIAASLGPKEFKLRTGYESDTSLALAARLRAI